MPLRLDGPGVITLQRSAGNRATKEEFGNSYGFTRAGASVEIRIDAGGGASTYTDFLWDFSTQPGFTTAGTKVDGVTNPEVKVTILTTYQAGVTGAKAQSSTNTYVAAVRKWYKKALDESEKKTDQVGKPGKHTKK